MLTDAFTLTVAATLLAGVLRTSIGVGAGIFLTASLAVLTEPKQALAVMAFLQIAFGGSAVFHYWRKWHLRSVIVLVLFAAVGALAGSWLVAELPAPTMRRVIGVALGSVALLALLRPQRTDAPPHMAGSAAIVATGMVGGVAGAIANAAGAVFALYLRHVGLAHELFLGTLSAAVLGLDLVRLVFYWRFDLLSQQALLLALMLLPAVFLGGWLGARLRAIAPQQLLGRAVHAMIVVLGVTLIL